MKAEPGINRILKVVPTILCCLGIEEEMQSWPLRPNLAWAYASLMFILNRCCALANPLNSSLPRPSRSAQHLFMLLGSVKESRMLCFLQLPAPEQRNSLASGQEKIRDIERPGRWDVAVTLSMCLSQWTRPSSSKLSLSKTTGMRF